MHQLYQLASYQRRFGRLKVRRDISWLDLLKLQVFYHTFLQRLLEKRDYLLDLAHQRFNWLDHHFDLRNESKTSSYANQLSRTLWGLDFASTKLQYLQEHCHHASSFSFSLLTLYCSGALRNQISQGKTNFSKHITCFFHPITGRTPTNSLCKFSFSMCCVDTHRIGQLGFNSSTSNNYVLQLNQITVQNEE